MNNFKSLPQLLDHFRDEKICIAYYEKLRWNGKPICPFCKSEKPYRTKRGFKCSNNECKKHFTVKVGSIFENSKIPFRIWFGAIFLCVNHKKGISSVQLAIDLNLTQKTAWFVLHRVREMLKGEAPDMVGGGDKIVEGDATFIGGKEKNKHYSKRIRREVENPTPTEGKKTVIGIIERNGKVILKHVPSESESAMLPFIRKYVPKGARVITDEHFAYKNLGKDYVHDTINHNIKIYVNGEIHSNTIENFWSVLKRGLYGVYHGVSDKHLTSYLNEFASRFNTRKLGTEERFENFLVQSEHRLLYKNLIAKAS